MELAVIPFVHLIVTLAKLCGLGGIRGVLAETLLLKHHLMVSNRPRRRAANLTTLDDLERKLSFFKTYYNEKRTHPGTEASPPAVNGGVAPAPVASLEGYRWQKQCGGLFQLPVAARLPFRHGHDAWTRHGVCGAGFHP